MCTTPDDAGPCVAVMLAGGGADDPLARHQGVPGKAHLRVGGTTLAQLVQEALTASRRVERIIYVGAPPAGIAEAVDGCIPSGQRLADSLALGLGAALAFAPRQLLIITADLPWISAPSVDRFVADAPRVDLIYPIVADTTMTARFPEQRRTFVRTADGRFTGGNLVLLTPRTVAPLLPFLDRLERARKNPLTLSTLFGPAVILGLLRGTLRVTDLEQRVGGMLGVSARAFASDDPVLAADLDRIEHLGSLREHPLRNRIARENEEISP